LENIEIVKTLISRLVVSMSGSELNDSLLP